jgi:outer membrane lipoprotein-sorting protein
MKKLYYLPVLFLLVSGLLFFSGCGGDEEEAETTEEPAVQAAGTYEGQWEMSPRMKPLASLVLTEDNSYEFYISIMGLMEEGAYSVEGETITFDPSAEGSESRAGSYSEGMIEAPFRLGKDPVTLTLTMVGSPDDVYASFLGDYMTTVMGNKEVILELQPEKQYMNTLSGEGGTFVISNGDITLNPDRADADPVEGTINPATKEITVNMAVMPGTPSTDLTFRKLTEEDMITYKGTAEKGMGGSTEVTLLIKKGGRFEVLTSKPRGRGNYTVGDGNSLTLQYTDPEARPDGSEFVMTGKTSSKDLFSPENEITVDTIEYIVVMQEDPSVMDLGTVTFSPVEE